MDSAARRCVAANASIRSRPPRPRRSTPRRPTIDPRSPGPPPPHAKATQRIKNATVYLRVALGSGIGIAEGTGFFSLEPGIVVTNAHVLGMLQAESRPPSNIDVVLHSGEPNEITMKGSVLGVD